MSEATERRTEENAVSWRSPTGVLVVSSVPKDHESLRRILGRTHRTYNAGSCRQALDYLSRGGIAIVLCDYDLPDGTWLDILHFIQREVDPPLLIVTTRVVDGRLWGEVINLGGFDVLAKPFEANEVEHVIKTAWACRHSPGTRHFAAGA